ncbi:hypothetical protein SAMN04488066_10867 [Halorubrum aquaticum]|uniref:Uncharacterized protein n=1 Tax=Halorubrum aquaticum TaxID=387340 RepID=A0A1I3AZG5_9EURY|nr:hypothetical protein [Halorubrum aquaticum]SFH55330.1 hypothetical protein SAMN04488066_10867 [Halorubrum aquaticum]
MIDENGNDDPDHRSENRPVPPGSLTRYVPGAATNAPKRNVLVVLAYLLTCVLAVGLLQTAL